MTNKMVKMLNVIDTWNVIEKYDINGYQEIDNVTIEIPVAEYKRVLNTVNNKNYIKGLKK